MSKVTASGRVIKQYIHTLILQLYFYKLCLLYFTSNQAFEHAALNSKQEEYQWIFTATLFYYQFH